MKASRKKKQVTHKRKGMREHVLSRQHSRECQRKMTATLGFHTQIIDPSGYKDIFRHLHIIHLTQEAPSK